MTSKLRMPEPYKLPRRGDADPGHEVKKIRTVPARAGSRDQDEGEIQLTTPVPPPPITNEALVMQVGSLEVGAAAPMTKTHLFLECRSSSSHAPRTASESK